MSGGKCRVNGRDRKVQLSFTFGPEYSLNTVDPDIEKIET